MCALPVEHWYSDSVLALGLNTELVSEHEGMYDPALGQLVPVTAEGLHLAVGGPQRNLKCVEFGSRVDLLRTQSCPVQNMHMIFTQHQSYVDHVALLLCEVAPPMLDNTHTVLKLSGGCLKAV